MPKNKKSSRKLKSASKTKSTRQSSSRPKAKRTRQTEPTRASKKVSKKKTLGNKKTVHPKRSSRANKTPVRKKAARRKRPIRDKNPTASIATFELEGLGSESAGQSGDTQGLSHFPDSDSESVAELLEEGQAFEAGVISGVENAPNADEAEVTTTEEREDDVPPEYHGKD